MSLRSAQRPHGAAGSPLSCPLLNGCQRHQVLVQRDGAGETAHSWSQLECPGCSGVAPARLGTAAECLARKRRRAMCAVALLQEE